MSNNLLIQYVYNEAHVDPNFVELVYGDSGNRASRLRNLVSLGSYVFFHTNIGGKKFITGYFYIDKILQKGLNDNDIKSLITCDAKVDEFIIVGDKEKSKILTSPLPFDKKLALELTSLGIDEHRFLNASLTELSVISSATREHRELSLLDTKILLAKTQYRG